MRFDYQARDAQGRIRDGEIQADSADQAAITLRKEGLYLLKLDAKSDAPKNGPALFRKRVSRSDVIYFTSQLAIMIDAGVPLAGALDSLSRQSENPTLKEVLQAVQRSVEAGDDLSVALARFPKQFDTTYVNLVRASEASGTLPQMLERIAVQSRAELDTRQKVRGALMYPGAMLCMCVGVSGFLLAYVFPKLTPMFASKKMSIPGPTKFMMALSELVVHRWYFLLAGAAALVVGFVYARRQAWGRTALDWCWLYCPVLGTMCRKVAISRSLRTLATTINAGVPVLEALELSAGVADNVFYERCWKSVGEQVTGGRQIHEALEGSPLIPGTILQMIASGESTGKLGLVLNKVSDYFDREVDNAIKSALSLVEPLMVFVMGGVIGSIALAMLLPIFKLSTGH